MKIVVYFETPKVLYAEVVAQFASEELYMACLPILEQIAERGGFIVSESIREDDVVTDAFDTKEIDDGI
jgi:hypothetical protein